MTERATPRKTGMTDYVAPYGVAASTKIEAGKLVALNAAGDAVEYAKGTANEGLTVVGRCEETVDNSDGAAGDLKVRARIGVFRWNNDVSSDAVTKADIGNAVHGEDDETIRKTAVTSGGGNVRTSKVGRLVEVDDDGAWVATGIPFLY